MRRIRDWRKQSYDRQMAVRNRSLFGAADFYSEGLKANGVEAADIHLNNRAMQLRWAAEHGVNIPRRKARSKGVSAKLRRLFRGKSRPSSQLAAMPDWTRNVMIAQIEAFRPT